MEQYYYSTQHGGLFHLAKIDVMGSQSQMDLVAPMILVQVLVIASLALYHSAQLILGSINERVGMLILCHIHSVVFHITKCVKQCEINDNNPSVCWPENQKPKKPGEKKIGHQGIQWIQRGTTPRDIISLQCMT